MDAFTLFPLLVVGLAFVSFVFSMLKPKISSPSMRTASMVRQRAWLITHDCGQGEIDSIEPVGNDRICVHLVIDGKERHPVYNKSDIVPLNVEQVLASNGNPVFITKIEQMRLKGIDKDEYTSLQQKLERVENEKDYAERNAKFHEQSVERKFDKLVETASKVISSASRPKMQHQGS